MLKVSVFWTFKENSYYAQNCGNRSFWEEKSALSLNL